MERRKRVKVIPMLSRYERGEYGDVSIVVPSSQLCGAATMCLQVGGFGEVIVAGGFRAVRKLAEILMLPDSGVEIEGPMSVWDEKAEKWVHIE